MSAGQTTRILRIGSDGRYVDEGHDLPSRQADRLRGLAHPRPDARDQDRATRARGRASATAPSTRHRADRLRAGARPLPPRRSRLERLVCILATGLFDPESLFRQPIMTVPLVHAVLSGLLLSADHDLRAQLDAPARSIGPTTVRRADEYIEQHAHEPLTVAQVASSAGVSIRALQQGFKRSLGATPTRSSNTRASSELTTISSTPAPTKPPWPASARNGASRTLAALPLSITRATTHIRRRRSDAPEFSRAGRAPNMRSRERSCSPF